MRFALSMCLVQEHWHCAANNVHNKAAADPIPHAHGMS